MISVLSCEDDSDCSGDRPRCLGKNCVDSQTAERWLCPAGGLIGKPDNIRFNMDVVEFISRKPPTGIVAKACLKMDIECLEPVDTFTDTTESGHVQLLLPYNFQGFFEVKSNDAIDTLLYIAKPITKNTLSRDLPVPSMNTIDVTSSISGYPYDPNKGLALLEAVNCAETPQGGVHFVSNVGGDPFYLVDQLPSKDTDVTVYDAAFNSANGGFINVPAGFVQFSAFEGVDGLELGSFNAQIRAHTITFIDMQF